MTNVTPLNPSSKDMLQGMRVMLDGAKAAKTDAVSAKNDAQQILTDATAAQGAIATLRDQIADTASDFNDDLTDFYKRMLGSFSADPTTDNDGGALQAGATYFNTVSKRFRVYSSGTWFNSTPNAWGTPAAWVTATAYVSDPPASLVTKDGSLYLCLVAHTSGTFSTDLAANKWFLLASKGDPGTGDVSHSGTVAADEIGTWADGTGTALKSSGVKISTDGTFAANSNAKVPTEQAAKTYIAAALAALVNAAPSTLDTLKELADALGDDPSFATTVTNALAAKLALSGGSMTGALNLAAWSDLASAATCDLSTINSNRVRITGTTGITSFGTGANLFRIIRFAGALTLTHNSTSLILPGGANITTAADDVAFVGSDGSGNFRVWSYSRASGKPIVANTASEVGAIAAAGDSMTGALNLAAWADIASAATCDLSTTTTNRVRITGTTTITSFGTGANLFRVLRFAAGLTLTHNSTTLILPGAANIATAADDMAFASSDGSGNWRVWAYTRASGKPVIANSASEVGAVSLSTAQQTFAGGVNVTVLDNGTKSSGTFTPNPGDRPIQKYTNNGAHTLAPGSNYGAYLLYIVNGASAGAITTSGFTKVAGDSFTTTNANKFLCHVTVTADFSCLIVQALQ